MFNEQQQIEAAIVALEARRSLLGDHVVDVALASLRAELAALTAAQPREKTAPTLRQVTILFVDIVGSTMLSQRLDPEDVSAAIGGAMAQFAGIVNARHGKVLQYAGDGLLAVFGADETREDDPERAVRCGLDLLEAGRLHREMIKDRHRFHHFDVRVGVHTGGVLLATGADAWNRVSGQAVNIAARMEQTAPPGTLHISHATYGHVRGLFNVEQQPPLLVKGVDEPIVTYLVKGTKPRAFRNPARGIEGVETRLVGRDAELARLVATLDTVVSDRRLQAVTIVGEPGTGKSRLLQELQGALDARPERCWLLMARADPLSQMQPYGLLRSLLAWRLQIADSDSSSVARAKLVEGLAPWLGDRSETKAHLIGQLIGMDFAGSPHVRGLEPRLLRSLAFSALHDYLRGLAADGSIVILLLEDLHWADDDSLDFIAELRAGEPPLALVGTARPALLERRPDWGSTSAAHDMLHLGALDAAHSSVLARVLLQRIDEGAESIHQLLVAQADGNPFYMEELVRMLIDDGVIVTTSERWHVQPERLQMSKVPTTLVGVLQARIDTLSEADRHALQKASIVGHIFWDDALASLDPRAIESLPALQKRSLVLPSSTSAFDGTKEEAFHHHLLHQVTYETVLKAARRAGHARAASWLAERVADRPAEYLAITAEHYERAGDNAKAFDYFERAALDARGRFANRAALDYAERALRLPETGDLHRRFKLYAGKVQVADLIGQRALQEAAIEECAKIADALDEDALRADALMQKALLASRRGDQTGSYELARQVVDLAHRSGAVDAASLALGQMAWARFANGDAELARLHARDGLANVREALSRQDTPTRRLLEVQILILLGSFAVAAGDHKLATATLLEAGSLARTAGFRRPLASVLEMVAVAEQMVGQYAQARARFEECLAIASEIGWMLGAATARLNIAKCCWELRETERAALELETAEADARRCEMPDVTARCMLLRGRMMGGAGNLGAALSVFEQALSIFEAVEATGFATAARAHMAEIHMRQGQMTQALALTEPIDTAVAAGLSIASTDDPLFPRLVCYRVWAAAGDSRASSALEAMHADLDALAARSSDDDRRVSILQNVPVHREIIAAWAAHHASVGPIQ